MQIEISTNFFTFGGSCNNAALLIQAKSGLRQYTHGLCWDAKFYLNVFTVSQSSGQKPQFWAKFDSYTDPLLPMRAKFGVLEQTHSLRLRAKFCLDRLWRRQNPHFTILLTSALCDDASCIWKTFGVWHLVSPLAALKIHRKPVPGNLNPHNSETLWTNPSKF